MSKRSRRALRAQRARQTKDRYFEFMVWSTTWIADTLNRLHAEIGSGSAPIVPPSREALRREFGL